MKTMLALALFLTGCVATELKVINRTGSPIQFYTDHTKKTCIISDGDTVTVPHTAGRITVITPKKETWHYDALTVPDYASETIKSLQRLTLPVTIGPQGTVTLRSGRKIEPKRG